MAVEVLRRGIIHQARHDLESFYWLLLWLIFRHTKHSGVDTYQRRSDRQPASYQTSRRFLTPMCGQLWHGNSIPPRQPLTYDSVLRLFDDSLARPDWPERDAAIPFKPGVLSDKAHHTRKSTWFSTADLRDFHNQRGSNLLSLQPAPSTLFALAAAPEHGGSDGAARLAWTAGRSARADGYPPRTPQRTAHSRLPHPIERLSTLPRYRSDADSPSPSLRSRRGSSAASRMQAHSGEDSQSSGSSHPMPSESSNAKRSGRKRSHEELAMNGEAPEKEPSKRSRTHSGQTVPSLKALGKRRMDRR
ncbi:hypothetical protein DAEQUDRAFT_185170 [Daedalea quercina L-15889]|uniref:Fungal-type protein kinase domain-containing protein n=1 Tax=Daedalea quercina L-15889 TaxID=1314783 RepID=A0A165KIC0_9APHY|nr:hypothetical protein DAEQUDRAFT_185170 [Daedalea quercina L-15889]